MAKKNSSIVGTGLIVLIVLLVDLFTNKKFLIGLGFVVLFIIIYLLLQNKKKKQQDKENDDTAVSTQAENNTVSEYNLQDLPGNVPYFISAALESESQNNFLTARVNYMKAVEELKRTTEPNEYEQLIEPVQKMYDEFVLRDPVYKYLMSKLLPIIEKQNGILQSEISKDFETTDDWGTLTTGNREVAKDDIYYALYFADQFGHIKRIKKGRSYQLYLPGTEPSQD